MLPLKKQPQLFLEQDKRNLHKRSLPKLKRAKENKAFNSFANQQLISFRLLRTKILQIYNFAFLKFARLSNG
jgi:hypothetical protein